MMSEKPSYAEWWNYKTRSWDSRMEPPTTDEEAEQYLPQLGGAGLYRLNRAEGDTILEAMRRVLLDRIPKE